MMIYLGEEVTHEKELKDLKEIITRLETENAALRERLEEKK